MWSSDYHLNTTGEVLVADEVRVTVTPSGEVTAKATFAPDPPPVSEC